LRQRQLPWLLLVVVNFAELRWIHSQFAGHLHLDVRQVVTSSRILPHSHLLLLFFCIHGSCFMSQNASIVGEDRVVFNIKGNDYRLVVAIDLSKAGCFHQVAGNARNMTGLM